MPAPKADPAVKRHAGRLRKRLAKLYPDAACALHHDGPLQLLVATILSAQCTDARVNLVTPALFAKYPAAADYAAADQRELESYVAPTGFFRNKAKNIREACRLIVGRHGGEVPRTLDELVLLPGVGRKTANVVLGNCFDTPGLTVDTHVGRLSRRLGLTLYDDPVKVEADLMQLIPQPEWTLFSHRMISHGRQVCHSRTPNCDGCPLRGFCPRVGVS